MTLLHNVTVTMPNGTKFTIPEVHAETLVAVVDPQATARGLYANMPVLTFPDEDLCTMARALCEAGRRIPAIKLVRAIYGLGLKEAKAWVDQRFPAPAFDRTPNF